jgi:hypothetical protein
MAYYAQLQFDAHGRLLAAAIAFPLAYSNTTREETPIRRKKTQLGRPQATQPRISPHHPSVSKTLSRSLAMSGPIIHHAHRPIGNADVLGVIVNICKEEKAYRTILLVALMSKHHHAIVQPVLTRIKNRVVLDLDDFAWRNKENDGNIE